MNALPLYSGRDDCTRIIVRRLQDTLHKLWNGIDITGHIRVIFVREAAVDNGGPLREYFYLLIKSISEYNAIFCGPAENKVPRHNVVELKKKTYYYVELYLDCRSFMVAQHHSFFSSAAADYIVYGASNVKATPLDVVDIEIMKRLKR